MNKFFRAIGMISLICFSFFFTDKTANVLKEMDSIMVAIKNESDDYKVDPIDAMIVDNDIIPGINGKVVDENASYRNMKRLGSFNSNMLVYNYIKPNVSLTDNYDKYIVSGNASKNTVSLIFLVSSNVNVNSVLDILNKSKTKANFFVNYSWFEGNNEKVLSMIRDNHNIGILSENYSGEDFIWMNDMIKKVGKQRYSYCYTEEYNDSILNSCSKEKNYTIKPTLVVDDNPLIKIKGNIKSGSIISIKVSDELIEQLSLIINYINSKGYKIDNLVNHLSEDI